MSLGGVMPGVTHALMLGRRFGGAKRKASAISDAGSSESRLLAAFPEAGFTKEEAAKELGISASGA